ncbi:unnamed protein product [Clonostachys solani]|uniref:Uncharacterized protein n=1 Tax=Clonostachys solani TaxID=160281 RepID=A0A9N9ZA54_9HYPO|nr:unnamed protein product [Clonostachys solani]
MVSKKAYTAQASGIGRATALAYARYGALGLVVADVDEPGAQEAAKEAKQQATNPDFTVYALCVDVRDFQSVEKVFAFAVDKFKRVDYSVNSVGIAFAKAFIADNSLDLYDNTQNINTKGVLYHTKAAVEVMLKQDPVVIQGHDRVRTIGRGSIVNVCSDASIIATPSQVEYNASKFAALAITKTAANEYGASQIRINALCPGPIETPLLERYVAANPAIRDKLAVGTTLGRVGDVDEVADSILFLTSTAGSFVHGSTVVVDGGLANNVPGL